MRIRFCAALLLAALAVSLFAGCAPSVRGLEALEETIENRLDAAEDAVEKALKPAAAEPAPTGADLISEAEAVAIALKDAGFEQTQVTRLRTEFGYDDGRPEYEVDFHQGGYEYDYEIDAVTGEIFSRDQDRED